MLRSPIIILTPHFLKGSAAMIPKSSKKRTRMVLFLEDELVEENPLKGRNDRVRLRIDAYISDRTRQLAIAKPGTGARLGGRMWWCITTRERSEFGFDDHSSAAQRRARFSATAIPTSRGRTPEHMLLGSTRGTLSNRVVWASTCSRAFEFQRA